MTTRHARAGTLASLLTFGMVAAAAVTVSAQTTTLPDKGGMITVVGCFTHGQIEDKDAFVLVRPIVGSVDSVADASCAANTGDAPVKLQDLKQSHLAEFAATPPGRWMKVCGRLEGNHGSDGIRELHVKSFGILPIMQPRVAVSGLKSPAFD